MRIIKILSAASIEHRSISNFVTAKALQDTEESYYADPIEMAQITSDKCLLEKLKASNKNGKLVDEV